MRKASLAIVVAGAALLLAAPAANAADSQHSAAAPHSGIVSQNAVPSRLVIDIAFDSLSIDLGSELLIGGGAINV